MLIQDNSVVKVFSLHVVFHRSHLRRISCWTSDSIYKMGGGGELCCIENNVQLKNLLQKQLFKSILKRLNNKIRYEDDINRLLIEIKRDIG